MAIGFATTFADTAMNVTNDLNVSTLPNVAIDAGTNESLGAIEDVDAAAKAKAADEAARTAEARAVKKEVEAVIGRGGRGVVGYRDFFYPLYHGEPLSYCTEDQKNCGFQLASKYCAEMGYDRASRIMIDHNVGVTRYPKTKLQCQGWRCDGFKLITCEASLKKTPIPDYYYRLKDFMLPRVDNYRIDWCYKTHRGCGRRAANAFCRYQGYARAQSYEKAPDALATRTIGSDELCFGHTCVGFSRITCYR